MDTCTIPSPRVNPQSRPSSPRRLPYCSPLTRPAARRVARKVTSLREADDLITRTWSALAVVGGFAIVDADGVFTDQEAAKVEFAKARAACASLLSAVDMLGRLVRLDAVEVSL